MSQSIALTLALLILAVVCLSPQIRAFFTEIALRRFFDRYMSEPRYRITNPRDRSVEDNEP